MRTINYIDDENVLNNEQSDVLSGRYTIIYDEGYWLMLVTRKYVKAINSRPCEDISELMAMIR